MVERLSVPPGPSSNTKIIIGLLISGLLILSIAGYILFQKRAPKPPPPPPPVEEPVAAPAPLIVSQPTRPLLQEPDAGKPAVEEKKPGKRPGKKEREQGTIDAKAVSNFINARFGQVRACYEHRLKTNSFLEGKLDLNIEINLNGRTSGISVNRDTVGDSEMLNCVKKVIRGWQFPKPVGGRVTIGKTFNFKKKS